MYNDCERCHSSGKAICVKCHEAEIKDLKAQVATARQEANDIENQRQTKHFKLTSEIKKNKDLKAQVARLNEEIGRGSDSLDGLVRDFYSLMEYPCVCPISEHCEFCQWAVHDVTGCENPNKDDDETCIERIKNHYSNMRVYSEAKAKGG